MIDYSIVQVNINNYDIPFKCNAKNSKINIQFTDNNYVNEGWVLQKCTNFDKNYPFDEVFKIRWNIFDYTNTDYVLWVDGSIAIINDPYPLIEYMDSQSKDFAIIDHPYRTNVYDEYMEWIKTRNYDTNYANCWMKRMESKGFDIHNDSIYQTTIMIYKNSEKVKSFIKDVYEELFYLNKNHIERLDQTVASFILKTKHKDINLLHLPKNILNCQYFKLVGHR